MDKKPTWREKVKELKKMVDRLVRPRERQYPQPALQPIRPRQKF
jgi:translation elongation factor EF-Tu-like GTPase